MTSFIKRGIHQVLGIATLPAEDRATATGNVRKNGKDRIRSLGDMLA